VPGEHPGGQPQSHAGQACSSRTPRPRRRCTTTKSRPNAPPAANAVLEHPGDRFRGFSVRARNCLKKMNIRSLGDLVKTTEADLLAYKKKLRRRPKIGLEGKK